MPGQHTEHAFEAAIEYHLTAPGGYEGGNRYPGAIIAARFHGFVLNQWDWMFPLG